MLGRQNTYVPWVLGNLELAREESKVRSFYGEFGEKQMGGKLRDESNFLSTWSSPFIHMVALEERKTHLPAVLFLPTEKSPLKRELFPYGTLTRIPKSDCSHYVVPCSYIHLNIN